MMNAIARGTAGPAPARMEQAHSPLAGAEGGGGAAARASTSRTGRGPVRGADGSRGLARFTLPAALAASVFAASVFAFSAVASDTVRDPYTHFFQDTFGDFSEEIGIAREDGQRGVVIFFEMDECPFCERMRETVLNRTDVQDYYRERFRIFTVDIEGDTEVVDFEGNEMPAKDFAFKVNKVRATPVIAFYDLDGRRVVRFTGAVRDGQEFLWLGEFAADGYYHKTNFTRFKRAKRAAAAGAATQ